MKYLKGIFESQTKSKEQQFELIENIFLDYIDNGTCEVEDAQVCFRVLIWGMLNDKEREKWLAAYSHSRGYRGYSVKGIKDLDDLQKNLRIEIEVLDELRNIFKRLEYYGFEYETYIEDYSEIEIFISFLGDGGFFGPPPPAEHQ